MAVKCTKSVDDNRYNLAFNDDVYLGILKVLFTQNARASGADSDELNVEQSKFSSPGVRSYDVDVPKGLMTAFVALGEKAPKPAELTIQ